MSKNKLASVARAHGNWSLDGRVYEDNSDYIFVKFETNGAYIKCESLHKDKMFKGLPFSDVDYAIDWREDKKNKYPVSVESITTNIKNKEIESEAKKRARDNSTPYSERSKNIRQNRKDEIDNLVEKQKVKKTIKANEEVNGKVLPFVPRRKN